MKISTGDEEQLDGWVEEMKIQTCTGDEEQLDEWVEGRSKHRLIGSTYECCPDFSCCRPHLLQPPEVRRAFRAADERGRNKFLSAFLGGLISGAAPDLKVHIIAGDPEASS